MLVLVLVCLQLLIVVCCCCFCHVDLCLLDHAVHFIHGPIFPSNSWGTTCALFWQEWPISNPDNLISKRLQFRKNVGNLVEKNKLRLCIYKGLIVIPVAMENQEEHKEKKEGSTVVSIAIPVAMESEHEHKGEKVDSAVVKSQMQTCCTFYAWANFLSPGKFLGRLVFAFVARMSNLNPDCNFGKMLEI